MKNCKNIWQTIALYLRTIFAICYILFLDHIKNQNTSNTPIQSYILKKKSRQKCSSVNIIRPTLAINFRDK